MPISQERMLRLLNAAEDLEYALGRVITLVEREAGNARAGRASAEAALNNIFLMAQRDLLLTHPVDTSVTMVTERQHFSPSRQRMNQREANRARRRRQQTPPEGPA